jgi:hypothetical protein
MTISNDDFQKANFMVGGQFGQQIEDPQAVAHEIAVIKAKLEGKDTVSKADEAQILTQLQSIQGKTLTPIMFQNLASGKPILDPPQTNTSPPQGMGNSWLGANGMISVMNNALDNLQANHLNIELWGKLDVQSMQLGLELGKELGEVKKDIREEQAKQAMYKAVMSGVSMAVSVGGFVAGTAMKTPATAEFGTSMGGQIGRMGESLVDAVMLPKIGVLEQKEELLRANSQVQQKMQQTADDQSKQATDYADSYYQKLQQMWAQLKQGSGWGVHG